MAGGALTVDVTGGRIQGVLRRGLRMWRGIPYAASTAGANRFRAPQPVEPGSVSAMDVTDPLHPQLSRFHTGRGRPAGPWGRGGPVAADLAPGAR